MGTVFDWCDRTGYKVFDKRSAFQGVTSFEISITGQPKGKYIPPLNRFPNRYGAGRSLPPSLLIPSANPGTFKFPVLFCCRIEVSRFLVVQNTDNNATKTDVRMQEKASGKDLARKQ